MGRCFSGWGPRDGFIGNCVKPTDTVVAKCQRPPYPWWNMHDLGDLMACSIGFSDPVHGSRGTLTLTYDTPAAAACRCWALGVGNPNFQTERAGSDGGAVGERIYWPGRRGPHLLSHRQADTGQVDLDLLRWPYGHAWRAAVRAFGKTRPRISS